MGELSAEILKAGQKLIESLLVISPGWLLLSLIALYLSHLIRQKAWAAILRASYPEEQVRYRDVALAFFTGGGLNGFIPARGGDLVKLWVLKSRIKNSSYPTLASSLAPEGLFEMLIGISLGVWAISAGYLPAPELGFFVGHFLATGLTLAALAAAAYLGLRSKALKNLLAKLAQGSRILTTPKHYLKQVVSWQLLARGFRLISICLMLKAFSLPAGLEVGLMIMAIQGASKLIPVAALSAGAHFSLIALAFTGSGVALSKISNFVIASSLIQVTLGILISFLCLSFQLKIRSPRKLLAKLKSIRHEPFPQAELSVEPSKA